MQIKGEIVALNIAVTLLGNFGTWCQCCALACEWGPRFAWDSLQHAVGEALGHNNAKHALNAQLLR